MLNVPTENLTQETPEKRRRIREPTVTPEERIDYILSGIRQLWLLDPYSSFMSVVESLADTTRGVHQNDEGLINIIDGLLDGKDAKLPEDTFAKLLQHLPLRGETIIRLLIGLGEEQITKQDLARRFSVTETRIKQLAIVNCRKILNMSTHSPHREYVVSVIIGVCNALHIRRWPFW